MLILRYYRYSVRCSLYALLHLHYRWHWRAGPPAPRMPKIERLARRLAWVHAFHLLFTLIYNAQKNGLRLWESYSWRIVLLSFKTHFGDNELFWDPFLTKAFARAKIAHPKLSDEEILDYLVFVGYAALRPISCTAHTFSHAGVFHYPIPQLLKNPSRPA